MKLPHKGRSIKEVIKEVNEQFVIDIEKESKTDYESMFQYIKILMKGIIVKQNIRLSVNLLQKSNNPKSLLELGKIGYKLERVRIFKQEQEAIYYLNFCIKGSCKCGLAQSYRKLRIFQEEGKTVMNNKYLCPWMINLENPKFCIRHEAETLISKIRQNVGPLVFEQYQKILKKQIDFIPFSDIQ